MKLCHVCIWLRTQIKEALVEFYIKFCRPHALIITPKGMNMDVVQGGTALFTVVATNKEGQVVPDTNITVSTDDSTIATATVNPDGSNGVVMGVNPGTTNLNATDGTVMATPVAVVVSQDLVVSTLTIVPA